MRLTLIKYQALGNAYLVVDEPFPLDEVAPLLPVLCHPHFGVGSDGLLLFDPVARHLRILNPDGSEAQRSGNGLRIAAAHAVLEHGIRGEFEIHTAAGPNHARIHGRKGARVDVEMDIGPPSFRAADLPALVEGEPRRVEIETPAGTVHAALVSLGNPHCVVFDEVVDARRAVQLGPHLERHALFPERTNVQLVEVTGTDRARIEIWERGAGYTLASGTSACAAAAALMREGLVGDRVTVDMAGGALAIRRDERGHLLMRGPAQRVCRALVDLSDLAGVELPTLLPGP